MDADAWDARYRAEELVWSSEPNRFLPPEVAELEPGRALDVACGEGRNTIWLATQGWEATGVDFSTVAIDKARHIAKERSVSATWKVLDVVTEDLEREAFDLVIVFYLQLPPEQRTVAFRRAAGAVAPGGRLIIVGHDSTNIARGWGGPQDPGVLYGPDEVISDITDTLAIERAERVERPVDTAEGPKVAIDVLVRAAYPVR